MARVSATAEDYERDREAEQQRVKDLLEDVETNIKQGSKLGQCDCSTMVRGGLYTYHVMTIANANFDLS